MPKVTSAAASTSPPTASSHPLKRNSACLNCRRRKLKCDAQRPCSTCVRSHRHLLAHPNGEIVPAEPDCTFDEVQAKSSADVPAKTKYEKLEARISELELLLAESQSRSGIQHKEVATNPFIPNGTQSDIPQYQTPPLTMTWSHWPQNLPTLDLLRPLCVAFLKFHWQAHRLLHPNFLASLDLPISHPKFPAICLLHSICAMASLYTAAVSSPPLPDFSQVQPDEIFYRRDDDNRPPSFAELQASYAKESAEKLEHMGEHLFSAFQTRVILSLFYWTHSQWVDVFAGTAHALRLSTALGLNVCFPFHSIATNVRPPSILPPARTVLEDETRRNVFWIAYANERQHGIGNGWALSLDDADVSQLLPVRGDLYFQGVLVPPQERQWAHSPDLFSTNPEEQTDSFLLYIKATILISRVKAFNCRFRARNFSGDTSAVQVAPVCHVERGLGDPIDPRGTPAFLELDHLIYLFQSSFPSNLKDSIDGSHVDNHLFSALLMPYVAIISLHEPHADVYRSGCLSAVKILAASRGILDLAMKIWSTSYDLTLLDTFCSVCFFFAGRVLTRFLKSAVDTDQLLEQTSIQAEVDFLIAAISKLGERIPLAFRFAKMLRDLAEDAASPKHSAVWQDSAYMGRDFMSERGSVYFNGD